MPSRIPTNLSKGILYIAAGEMHAEAAMRSAATVKQTNQGIPTCIITDCDVRDHFDIVLPLSNGHRRSKVDHLASTPFKQTLYLDSDTRVVGDVLSAFELLERFDIAIAHAHARGGARQNIQWKGGVPQGFPQMNGGVFYYRSSPEMLSILRQWSADYHAAGMKWDQVTLRELIWNSELKIYILPPEYNVRDRKYLSAWTVDEATPRILHMAEFFADENSLRGWFLAARNRAKRLVRRLVSKANRP